MKIRTILITIPLIGVVILVILVIIKINRDKSTSNTYEVMQLESENQVKSDYKVNSNNMSSISVLDKETFNDVKTITTTISKDNDKSNTNAEIHIINDIDLSYYSKANWLTEDIVVKEEKERLSFFERIDGKVAKVRKEIRRELKWLKDTKDENSYVKDIFVLVPVATNSDMAYKYYFDNNGYLITDNLSKDYTVLDKYGREIDTELKPVEYYIGNIEYSTEHIEKVIDSKEDVYYVNRDKSINSTPSQIIITEGVVFKKKLEKVFNTLIDKDMKKYIVGGSGYQKNTKAVIFEKAKWKDALKLRSNGSYIVFENRVNNFNKITGKVAMESTVSSDRSTSLRFIVYDKEEYDKGNLDEYLYYNDEFNYTSQKSISFTFDRSVRNIVFVLYVDGVYKDRSIYFKDLRYGFSKSAYRDELIRKKEEQEEIEYLKSLGLYVEDDEYFDIIDEEGEIIDEIDEELDDIEDFLNLNKYYDELLDRKSGPAFDKELNKMSERRIGPYYDIVGTSSEVKDRSRKSKIIFTE